MTIILRVHPQYGQQVAVLRTHGPEALWIETPDGEHRIVPAAWTDWRPRADCAEIGGRTARLAPEPTKDLAAYVAARRCARRQGDDSLAGSTENGRTDEPHVCTDEPTGGQGDRRGQRPAGGRRRRGRDRAPAPVVEQAGAPEAHRGSPGGKRGGR